MLLESFSTVGIVRKTSFGLALITCSDCCDEELTGELFVNCNLARALVYCEKTFRGRFKYKFNEYNCHDVCAFERLVTPHESVTIVCSSDR